MAYDTRELFARLIQCEAGGEGEDGMRESVGGVYNPQNVYNMNPTQEHFDIVDWAMGGGRLMGVDESLFFHNPYSTKCPTYFPTNVGVIHNRIGDHCFYLPTSYYADT